ncbi:sensor domain-containing phosphodiesterase [Halomonas sp. ANAO-440]|uniref:sensor domain-containing phosphodiesterase n=1 Tax=Halomonas sp. ANAO-440 TaxID=2861360 RepID=UPI001CAA74F9|nr:sensor domain-containing phosphodiesterase [Halomonas sp. ANAO-440]MBZ0330205.1 sensor domain-containing phosphodiesterase [Halomonas sp. ANAO-440]
MAETDEGDSTTAYMAPDIPSDEAARLEELHSLKLLDNTSDLRFDRYTNLVADIFDFPIVLITLVDRDRQWFKSSCGLSMRETSRDISFCAHAINGHDVMVVPDAREDSRFAGNPLVTGGTGIRFYAGAVVHGPSGQPLGTLCVLDRKPRSFDEAQCRRLREFGDLLESEIAHRHDLEIVRASIQFSAYYDPLTGLANRRLLQDRLSQLTEWADGEERPVGVLLFNISGLRLINQSFGSEVGDDLLCQFGKRLQALCPPGGTLARLQADEFILCFSPHKGDDRYIDAMASQAREKLSRPFLAGGRQHYLQVKIGASVFPQHGTTPAGLIERASAAIRFTASGETPGICFFTHEEALDISERLRIESRLQLALENCGLELAFQPIIDLWTGQVAAVEALCRWEDAELGRVGPDRFIPIAEQSGLIHLLGGWVQQAACEQIRQWQQLGQCRIPVAINVAAAELQHPDFARDLLAMLDAQDIDAGLLWLEITEHSLVSDSPLLARNLALLTQAKIHLSIDDFGTGYSSLSYLCRLPISGLKIDRSFIERLPGGEKELALARSIIRMADAFGLETVAEGVEDEQQLACLIDQGCRFAQGFLIARPVSAGEVPALCRRALVPGLAPPGSSGKR